MLAVLLVAAIGAALVGGMQYITAVFLREQDLVVAAIILLCAVIVVRKPDRFAKAYSGAFGTGRQNAILAITALLVVLVGWGGSFLVFGGFPLSLDEFWARADGEILARGVPLARIPEEWRDYATALQPTFLRLLPQEGLWASSYLPVNAMLQQLGGSLASPAMAGGSVVLTAMIVRRLLPDMPRAPIIAAILLATSSQLLVAAMTPYAMSAHLFFNLLWLWLFMQGRAWAIAASLLVGALAMGLHQEVFFPIFAVPFLLERFLAGRRLFAVAYLAAIGALFLAWNNYDLFAYGWFGAEPPAQADTGTDRKLADLFARLSGIGASSIAMMGANLLRFVVWQNPVVPVLLTIAAWPIIRLAGDIPSELRAMLVSIVGASVFMLLVIPLQGHGWGYRYLHGQLGTAAIIATYAFCRLANGTHERGWKAILVAMTLVAALLVPLRAWQAHGFAKPYISADAAIENRNDAQVVVIDAPRHAYASDLTRNDPWLRNPVKRMDAGALTTEGLLDLCERYRVEFFTDEDAARYGIPLLPGQLRQDPRFPGGCNAQ